MPIEQGVMTVRALRASPGARLVEAAESEVPAQSTFSSEIGGPVDSVHFMALVERVASLIEDESLMRASQTGSPCAPLL